MKNSKLRRALMLVACAAMLVSLSVGATLAYLTAQTGTVTNTFTVGNVKFDESLNDGLDEADVNVYGELEYEADGTTLKARVKENEYKLIPGHTYVKDPTVHLAAGSESCYLFILVNKTDLKYTATGASTATDIEAANDSTDGGYKTIANQIAANGWVKVENITNTPTGATLYVYNTKVDTLGTNPKKDFVIFKEFKLADNATLPISTDASQLNIKIKAYAVQADGFSDVMNGETVTKSAAAVAWDAANFSVTNPFATNP